MKGKEEKYLIVSQFLEKKKPRGKTDKSSRMGRECFHLRRGKRHTLVNGSLRPGPLTICKEKKTILNTFAVSGGSICTVKQVGGFERREDTK